MTSSHTSADFHQPSFLVPVDSTPYSDQQHRVATRTDLEEHVLVDVVLAAVERYTDGVVHSLSFGSKTFEV